MTELENIRESLISHILASKNERLLIAINNIFDSTESDEMVTLSPQQIEILMMSDRDIENGNLISSEELAKSDMAWLK
jgi:hypothetical protein